MFLWQKIEFGRFFLVCAFVEKLYQICASLSRGCYDVDFGTGLFPLVDTPSKSNGSPKAIDIVYFYHSFNKHNGLQKKPKLDIEELAVLKRACCF
jgi:hypothetical protein